MNAEKPKKKSTEKIDLEKLLKNSKDYLKRIIKRKKEIEKEFSDKFKEIERQNKENKKAFEKAWTEIEKLENQLLLWWDFWKREAQINRLREKTKIGSLPSEREKILEEITTLNSQNEAIQRSFEKGKIDLEIVAELRKNLEKELEEEKEKL